MRFSALLRVLLALMPLTPLAAQAADSASSDLSRFVRQNQFDRIEISPDGKNYALSVPDGDHSALVVLDAGSLKPIGSFSIPGKTQIGEFWWANPDSLIVSMAEKQGGLDKPVPTGELYVTNIRTHASDLLFGYRAANDDTGTHIQRDRQQEASATVIDPLPKDNDNVLIAVSPWNGGATTIERMDITTGHRRVVGRAPMPDAWFVADREARPRFAYGTDVHNKSKLYYRPDENAQWTLINDQTISGKDIVPLAFNEDESLAYLQSTEPTGPDSIQGFDVAKRSFHQVMRDPVASPDGLMFAPASGGKRIPIGAIFLDGKPRVSYFDPDSTSARLLRSVAAGFPDSFVMPSSATADGRLTLLETYSDRSSGDFFLFDSEKKTAALLIRQRNWIDPQVMAERKPFEFKARDGTTLHGYMTLPPGSTGKKWPLVVYPHGGPFKVSDTWEFDNDSQMLATHGYAVLQVNYRGSSGYGEAFETAGYRQWGRTMQDDLTDATHWAVDQGYANGDRICIYGASYGGYAALMGVAKEPALYRCAVGYVGVYDLDMLYNRGDTSRSAASKNFFLTTLGSDNLAAISPVNLASQIKGPVLLVDGGSDTTAPPAQTKAMEAALKKAGVPVQTLSYPDEGHGFYSPEHIRTFDQMLLDFLDQNIGDKAKPMH